MIVTLNWSRYALIAAQLAIGAVVQVVGLAADCHRLAARIVSVYLEPIETELRIEQFPLDVLDGSDQGLFPGFFVTI